MNSPKINARPKDMLLLVVLSMSMLFIVVFLDIPIARQVIGFLYLTFIPGFVFQKILNFVKLDRLETILFSVGFSIAFMMIVGLFTNEFLFMLGFSQPLSLMNLMIVLNSLILAGAVFLYLKGEAVEVWNLEPIKKAPFSLLFLGLPVLSIIGAAYVNAYQNSFLLIFTIIAIAILFILSVVSKKLLPSKFYPFALFMIAIAILFHSSLISNYIVPFGSDVPAEYYLFKNTQNNLHWSSTLPASMTEGLGAYNDMLSITILPTVYANILNLDAALVFKILYPLIFSFVPLGLYQIWQKYISKKYAFIAAFLFMAQMTFYTEMLGLNRQMIGELFFVMLLLVILKSNMKPINKTVGFIIFSFTLITSHYALATIFLGFISFAAILLIALKRPSKKITITMVLLFCTVFFTWYIYTMGSASFNSILTKVNYVNNQLEGFLNPASRGETVMTGLGLIESPSIWNTISRLIAYLVQGLIVLGFLGLITKRNSEKVGKEYFIFTIIATILLGMLVVVPGLANTLNMTRFYHILLFFLAPLCVMGASFAVKLIFKRQKEVITCLMLLALLVPYLLFQTNFVYEVIGIRSWSVPLSGYRMTPVELYGHNGYTDTYSVYGAQWLSNNVDTKPQALYADERTSTNVLTIHALIASGKIKISNVTTVADDGVVYLSSLNVIHGIVPYGDLLLNTSQLSPILDELNLIYANGGSEIYKKP